MNTWHSQTTSADQGLIIDDETGRNVAVSYDAKDAKLIAAAPELLNELQNALTLLEYVRNGENVIPAVLINQIYSCYRAIYKATEE